MLVLNHHKKLPINIVTFYAAQIVSCFEYLHSRGMVFRDLKPENVLVAKDGYLKLADFGFVKRLGSGEKTYTFCGTPEYIAPEIITNQGYSHEVDWYALGIMIYELTYGRPPFMANDPMDIFKMILTDKIKFPENFDPNAKSLIKHLCQHDLSKRFGSMKLGVSQIKEHRFFKDKIDFGRLLKKSLADHEIPYKPIPVLVMNEKREVVNIEKYRQSYDQMNEYNDNQKFPPIKVQRDPFLDWF